MPVFVKDGFEFCDGFHDWLRHDDGQCLIGDFLFEPSFLFVCHSVKGSCGFGGGFGMTDSEEFGKDDEIVSTEEIPSFLIQNISLETSHKALNINQLVKYQRKFGFQFGAAFADGVC